MGSVFSTWVIHRVCSQRYRYQIGGALRACLVLLDELAVFRTTPHCGKRYDDEGHSEVRRASFVLWLTILRTPDDDHITFVAATPQHPLLYLEHGFTRTCSHVYKKTMRDIVHVRAPIKLTNRGSGTPCDGGRQLPRSLPADLP